MSEYKEMYLKLVHAATDAVNALQKAQQEAEALFLEKGEEVSGLQVLPFPMESEKET